jgi:hypothetical protein
VKGSKKGEKKRNNLEVEKYGKVERKEESRILMYKM